jgi:hypothetical protein
MPLVDAGGQQRVELKVGDLTFVARTTVRSGFSPHPP